MQNKQKITFIIIGVVIVILLGIVLFVPRPKTSSPAQSQSGAANQTASIPQSTTVAPVPANVVVPNEGDKNVASGVAAPQIQTAAHPSGGSASYRQFPISAGNDAANNDVFTPATVIVNKGDIIDLEITAVNHDYDFTQPDYGFSAVLLPKGKTTKVQFEALNVGKFTFYCTSCGGPAKGPVGYIIITD
jgi:plastocyanin